MGTMINRRRYSGKKLPYDAEIEYLRSTGTQYINTGVILQRADLCRMDIVCTSYVNNVWSVNGLSGTVYRGPNVGINSSKIFTYAANAGDTDTNTPALLGFPYRYNLDIKNSTYIIEDYLNGTEVYHNDNITKSQDSPQRPVPMIIFGYHSSIVMPRVVAIYKAAIYENDVLLRDFIPVRIGTTGYLYDKVSGQLFGNAGTGDFILGLDKGHKNPVNINVRTHNTGDGDASLDVITGGGEPVNILYKSAREALWTNDYILIEYNQTAFSWRIYAVTPCLYDGQVYKSGELIATWDYREIRDIIIVANI